MHLCEFNVYEFIKLNYFLFYKINRSYFSMTGKSNGFSSFRNLLKLLNRIRKCGNTDMNSVPIF